MTPVFILWREDKIQAGIPLMKISKFGFNSYYSMPYGGYGSILLSNNNKEKANELIHHLSCFTKGRWGIIELVDFYNELEGYMGGFNRDRRITHILPLLPNSQEVWEKSINPKTRNKISQAQKKGITVSIVESENEIKECYKMREDTIKRHEVSTNYLPLKFYLALFDEMKNYLRWTIAYKDNQALAYAIHFVYKDTIIWWDNSSYTSALQYRPNNALIWEAIKWGCENGYKYYNLGGSPSEGLIKFKESWGADEKVYWAYYKKSKVFSFLKHLQEIFKFNV
jgi:lipid II:glycine glycyltransferase (peptidoglycan interpeptide bridge formation enzyme)